MTDKYALQKVQIRNTMPLSEAEKHYKNITKRKPRKVRETENFYQFRYLPPTKFQSRSFKTKVVNDDIHLIYGKLKDSHVHLEGRGLFDYFTKAYDYVANKVSGAFDYIKNAVSINDYSDKTKSNLKQYGEYPIIAIQIRRVPIAFALDLALQGISAGEWERLKNKYGFDKFYHLSMVVTLKGAKEIVLNRGKRVRQNKQLAIEKLEVVSVNENIEIGDGMETQDVIIPKGKIFNINGMFEKAREKVGDTLFFSYSALGHNNCQDFIALLLEVEDLYNEPERLFVYQDISQLVKELPDTTKAVSQGITHIGALANKYLGIGGSRATLDSLYKEHIVGRGNSDSEDTDKAVDKEGGNKASGFIKAMMARDKATDAQKKEYANTNKSKFGSYDAQGFDITRLTKATHNLLTTKKAITKQDAIKRFFDYIIANAPQHQPIRSGGVNYDKTYDVEGMYDAWIDSEGLVVEDKPKAKPAPAPVQPKAKRAKKEEKKEEDDKEPNFTVGSEEPRKTGYSKTITKEEIKVFNENIKIIQDDIKEGERKAYFLSSKNRDSPNNKIGKALLALTPVLMVQRFNNAIGSVPATLRSMDSDNDFGFVFENDKNTKKIKWCSKMLITRNMDEPNQLYIDLLSSAPNAGGAYLLFNLIKDIIENKNGKGETVDWKGVNYVDLTALNSFNTLSFYNKQDGRVTFDHLYEQNEAIIDALKWMKEHNKPQYASIKKLVKKGSIKDIASLWDEYIQTNIGRLTHYYWFFNTKNSKARLRELQEQDGKLERFNPIDLLKEDTTCLRDRMFFYLVN